MSKRGRPASLLDLPEAVLKLNLNSINPKDQKNQGWQGVDLPVHPQDSRWMATVATLKKEGKDELMKGLLELIKKFLRGQIPGNLDSGFIMLTFQTLFNKKKMNYFVDWMFKRIYVQTYLLPGAIEALKPYMIELVSVEQLEQFSSLTQMPQNFKAGLLPILAAAKLRNKEPAVIKESDEEDQDAPKLIGSCALFQQLHDAKWQKAIEQLDAGGKTQLVTALEKVLKQFLAGQWNAKEEIHYANVAFICLCNEDMFQFVKWMLLKIYKHHTEQPGVSALDSKVGGHTIKTYIEAFTPDLKELSKERLLQNLVSLSGSLQQKLSQSLTQAEEDKESDKDGEMPEAQAQPQRGSDGDQKMRNPSQPSKGGVFAQSQQQPPKPGGSSPAPGQ